PWDHSAKIEKTAIYSAITKKQNWKSTSKHKVMRAIKTARPSSVEDGAEDGDEASKASKEKVAGEEEEEEASEASKGEMAEEEEEEEASEASKKEMKSYFKEFCKILFAWLTKT
uniref:Uncharacterized protein n=1 Tax=Glossina morsitans morsitans TaxID=37546 RepID=A0A1B0G4C3_GLOMM